ncbi:unnamed protein product [Eruca vesicaria subsp. sativa]|uniref:Uncharacterized protein n=1 Tax=Eruca vesicaria subsp. sativa TaxID=29727 RepID=A0ABC8J378_ERUVS|nr:unnamed protein product [Eruca vesicaria subsp. sativa]
MVASDSRPMRLRLRAELFLASFAVREESIRNEEGGGAYISKYIKGILKSRLSRREQSRWNIIDDTTSMAFFEEFSSLNPVFHTFLFYGRLPSPFSRVRNTSPHLSIHKKALPRGERKLQDEYALDSRIHSRPDPLWNFRNLQKHSRKGLRKANCLLAGSCMSGNVHVRFREKGGGQKWPWRNPLLSSSMGSALFFLGEYANMILMRCGTLHLTFVGLPSSGACVPAFLCNKPLRPKTSGRWSRVAFGEG